MKYCIIFGQSCNARFKIKENLKKNQKLVLYLCYSFTLCLKQIIIKSFIFKDLFSFKNYAYNICSTHESPDR